MPTKDQTSPLGGSLGGRAAGAHFGKLHSLTLVCEIGHRSEIRTVTRHGADVSARMRVLLLLHRLDERRTLCAVGELSRKREGKIGDTRTASGVDLVPRVAWPVIVRMEAGEEIIAESS